MSRAAGPDRPHRFTVRLTAEEQAELEAIAAAAQTSISDVFRAWLRREARKARSS